MRAALFLLIAVAPLSGCSEVAGTAAATGTAASIAGSGKPERACTAVSAIATGFGEKTVTGFAESNLTLAIDKAKDELAAQGAKGFTVDARSLSARAISISAARSGASINAHATAQLCSKV